VHVYGFDFMIELPVQTCTLSADERPVGEVDAALWALFAATQWDRLKGKAIVSKLSNERKNYSIL